MAQKTRRGDRRVGIVLERPGVSGGLFDQHQIERAQQAVHMFDARAFAHEADAPDLARERTQARPDLDAVIQKQRAAHFGVIRTANEPSQTLQNHDTGAETPRISAGLQVPPQPLRPPRARNPVSKALPSHSDPTCVPSG